MVNRALSWQKKPEEVTFPSGSVAMLKRVNVLSMMTSEGHIPDSFYSALFTGNGKPEDGQERPYFETMLKLASQVAEASFVSPRIVAEPDYEQDQIHISDVDDSDKMFLMNWMMYGGAPDEALRRFRQNQSS